MLYFIIGNYYLNKKKKIILFKPFLINFNMFYLKIKNIKKKMLNLKQIIFIMINTKKWLFLNFINILVHFTYTSNNITSNIDGIVKLYLISKGLEKPNFINLNNIFTFLKTIIWTNIGNFDLFDINNIFQLKNTFLIIESIDKIPYLTKYIIPKNVRISNSNRVRLGSYLSKGITIMSEGYVNFNTYIGENCMIEGRVSAGVCIFKNTDLGGSSSIMGTLSGGGNIIISVGENCLLGANSGLGISLGNNCIIESGLYITSGIKIFLFIKNKYIILKAKKLSFLNNLIFYRNSIKGRVECCKNFFNSIKINNILHNN